MRITTALAIASMWAGLAAISYFTKMTSGNAPIVIGFGCLASCFITFISDTDTVSFSCGGEEDDGQ